MKYLLILSAAIEASAGLALLGWPSRIVSLLLGTSLETSAALTVSRLAGAALFSLGIACWLSLHDGQSRATKGLVTAMAVYNFAAVSILTIAGIESASNRVLLWAAVGLHATMTIWCIAALRRTTTLGGTRKLSIKSTGY